MDETVELNVTKINHAQKIKGPMFSLICRSYTYKSNVYIETYISMEREREGERERDQNCISESI
jgi:hypothetical protein